MVLPDDIANKSTAALNFINKAENAKIILLNQIKNYLK